MSLQRIPLQPVDGVTISILADNLFDGLLPDQGPAKRINRTDDKVSVLFIFKGLVTKTTRT